MDQPSAATGSAAAAALLVALTVAVFVFSNHAETAAGSVELQPGNYSLDDLRKAVGPVAHKAGFTDEAAVFRGKVYVVDYEDDYPPRPGAASRPVMPVGKPAAIVERKCIVLDLGDSVPGAAGAGAGAAVVTPLAVLTEELAAFNLASPTSGANVLLSNKLLFVTTSPLSIAAIGPLAWEQKWLDDPSQLLVEGNFLELATAFMPAHSTLKELKKTAASVFGKPEHRYRWALDNSSKPDVTVCGKPGFAGKSGELKSIAEGAKCTLFEQLGQYGLMSIRASLFENLEDSPAFVFYPQPPLAFVLNGFAHVGYYMAVEVVGTVFLSPCSKPFFFGSNDHREISSALPDVGFTGDRRGPIILSGDHWTKCSEKGADVRWTTSALRGNFYKIIDASNATATIDFKLLHAVYSRFASALLMCTRTVPSLVSARLLYGDLRVAVEMPFVSGRHPDSFSLAPAVLSAVALAMAWLARHKLLYVDLRQDNILLTGAAAAANAVLIDYDDCLLLDRRVVDPDELISMLEGNDRGSHYLRAYKGLGAALRVAADELNKAAGAGGAAACTCCS